MANSSAPKLGSNFIPEDIIAVILSAMPTKSGVASCLLSKRWTNFWTVEKNVPEIELQVGGFELGEDDEALDVFEVPVNLFSCQTLVCLKLDSPGIKLNVPDNVDLPSLKTIHLVYVQYKKNASICYLLAGCRVLEELIVKREHSDGVNSYEISVPTLKRLSLCVDEHSMDDDITEFSFKKLSSLTHATLEMGDCRNCMAFIQHVCEVEFLQLSKSTMRAIRDEDEFPVFRNLTRLQLDGFSCFWGLLQHLLLSSSNLEHLTLITCDESCDSDFSKCWEESVTPKCLSNHLTTVCLEGLKVNLEGYIEFAGYILRHSLALKKLTIKCTDLNETVAVQRKIEEFGKVSEMCQLEFP